MEDNAVVERTVGLLVRCWIGPFNVTGRKPNKVSDRFRCMVGEKIDGDVAKAGMEDGDVCVCRHWAILPQCVALCEVRVSAFTQRDRVCCEEDPWEDRLRIPPPYDGGY